MIALLNPEILVPPNLFNSSSYKFPNPFCLIINLFPLAKVIVSPCNAEAISLSERRIFWPLLFVKPVSAFLSEKEFILFCFISFALLSAWSSSSLLLASFVLAL